MKLGLMNIDDFECEVLIFIGWLIEVMGCVRICESIDSGFRGEYSWGFEGCLVSVSFLFCVCGFKCWIYCDWVGCVRLDCVFKFVFWFGY